MYLVRRNLRQIYGPMTLEVFSERFRSREFSLGDEIARARGPWVELASSELLATRYPEVCESLSEVEQEEAAPAPRGTWLGLAAGALLVGAGVLAAAYYFLQVRLPLKVSQAADLAQFVTFYNEGRFADLEKRVEALLPELDEDHWEPWLPFVRFYAFRRDGEADPVSALALRGVQLDAAPVDCSQRAWRERFAGSYRQWGQLVWNKKIVAEPWAQVLAWDPHWVRRRGQFGWLYPKSFHAGCLAMAHGAFRTLVTDGSFKRRLKKRYPQRAAPLVAAMMQRLAWVSGVATGGSAKAPPPHKGARSALRQWTCYETATSFGMLWKCGYPADRGPATAWRKHQMFRFGVNAIRLALKSERLRPKTRRNLARLLKGWEPTDPFTGLAYQAEGYFLSALLAGKKSVAKARAAAARRWPSVDLH